MMENYKELVEYIKNFTSENLPDTANIALFDYNRDPLAERTKMKFLGRLPSKDSKNVTKSIMGIGFETMDRDTFEPANVIPLLGKTGVKYARCQTGWIKCEKVKGVLDFQWLDDIADALLENGIEPWFSLSFGNPLYTPNDEFRKAWETYTDKSDIPGWARGYVAEVPLYHGREATEAFLRYVRELARHFSGRVHVYEVWNEPEWFWSYNGEKMRKKLGDTQAAKDYAELVRLTAEAVHAVDPDARIASVTASTGSVYVRELGRAGIGNYADIHCFHYYGPEPENGLHERVQHLRECLSVPGRKLDIWQGESGRASGKSAITALPSEYNQAKFLVRRYFADAAEELSVSSIFTASDFRKYYQDGSDQYYGLIGVREVKPKLGYDVMQGCGGILDRLERDYGIFANFNGGEQRNRVEETKPYQAKIATFRRDDIPVVAIWQPAHVDLPHPAQEGVLTLIPRDDDRFTAPIVIDPIRRNVYALNCSDWGSEPNYPASERVFSRFPIVDYPLIVTDLALLDY